MKAEDTVMNGDEIVVILDNARKPCSMEFRDEPKIRAVARAQAEISFKAGIREVVDWVNSERTNQNPSVWYSRWQAQLQKWGINEN